jgi:hypothetical protein
MSGPDGDAETLASEIADLLAVDLDDAKLIEAATNGSGANRRSPPLSAPEADANDETTEDRNAPSTPPS